MKITLGDITPSEGDDVAPRFGGSGKQVFLKNGQSFLKSLGTMLADRGATKVKVRKNAGGPTVSGEATMDCTLPDGRILWAQISQAPFSFDSSALLWRVGTRPYATDGSNQWVEDRDATPASVFDRINRIYPAVNDLL